MQVPDPCPPPPQQLERPGEDRAHLRRASDEASQILRNFSMSMSMPDPKTMSLPYSGRHMAFPTDGGMLAHSFNESMFGRPVHFPLGELMPTNSCNFNRSWTYLNCFIVIVFAIPC